MGGQGGLSSSLKNHENLPELPSRLWENLFGFCTHSNPQKKAIIWLATIEKIMGIKIKKHHLFEMADCDSFCINVVL